MLTVASSTLALALCHRRQDSPGGKQMGEGGRGARMETRSKGCFKRAPGSAQPSLSGVRVGFGPRVAAISASRRNSRSADGVATGVQGRLPAQ